METIWHSGDRLLIGGSILAVMLIATIVIGLPTLLIAGHFFGVSWGVAIVLGSILSGIASLIMLGVLTFVTAKPVQPPVFYSQTYYRSGSSEPSGGGGARMGG